MPPTAMVWCVLLADKPPTINQLVSLCHRWWGRHYADIGPSRVRNCLRYATTRGWCTTTGDGPAATVAMAPGNRFRLEHDPATLRGHERLLQGPTADTAAAWRQAQAQAR